MTPVGFIDEAIWLALEKGVTVCTFGDLVRVPGTEASLQTARGKGAAVKVVYTPLDAERYAAEHPDKQVVFLSVGFETTTPSACLAVRKAQQEQVVFLSVGFETTTPSACLAVRKAQQDGIRNFSLLTANKTMPGAYEAMKDSTDLFLYPGHVHAITGTGICEKLAEEGVSGVCAGFTASELLAALAVAVTRYQEGKPFFVNCYPRVVRPEGSPKAQSLVAAMMEPCDEEWRGEEWRGIGVIPGSGMRLKESCQMYDARVRFRVPEMAGRANPACRCGQVLKGELLPPQCKVFGKACTPEHPVGACMVSSEGACSAWYLYGQNL